MGRLLSKTVAFVLFLSGAAAIADPRSKLARLPMKPSRANPAAQEGGSVGAAGRRISSPTSVALDASGNPSIDPNSDGYPPQNPLLEAIQAAGRGSDTAKIDGQMSLRSVSDAREEKRKVADTVRRLDQKFQTLRAAVGGAASAKERESLLNAPEEPFTCVYNKGVCKDNANLLEIHDPLRKRYAGIFRELDQVEKRLLGNAQGDFGTAAALQGHVQEMGKNFANLGSDLGNGRQGKTDAGGVASEARLAGDGFRTGQGSEIFPPGGKSGKSKETIRDHEGGSEPEEGTATNGLSSANFSVKVDEPRDEEDAQKLLAATPLVPESFLRNLEAKLAKVADDKAAIELVRELGRSAGIREIADLRSLEEMDTLEKQASGARAALQAMDGKSGASRTVGSGTITEVDAQFIQAVNAVLEEKRPDWQMAEKPSPLDGDAPIPGVEWSVGVGRGPAATQDGVGGKSADMFLRARKAIHAFYRANYM